MPLCVAPGFWSAFFLRAQPELQRNEPLGYPDSVLPRRMTAEHPGHPPSPSRRLAQPALPIPPSCTPGHGGRPSATSAGDTRAVPTRSFLRRRFEVWRPSDLRAEGVSDRSRSACLESGALISLGKGWYASPSSPADVTGPLSRGHRATCVTAAKLYGLWVPDAPEAHEVGLRRESTTSEELVTRHRPIIRTWPDDEPIMPLRTALLHAAHCLTPLDTAVLLESAIETWQLSAGDVAAILTELPHSRRRALGRISAHAGSGSETKVRRHLERRGVRVREQVDIPGVGRVDMLIGERLIIECDSLKHHGSTSGFHEDRRRDRMSLKGGYLVLRLTWHDIWLTWDETAELLSDLVNRRIHRGTRL